MSDILSPADAQNFLDDLAAVAKRKRLSGFNFQLSTGLSKSVSVRKGALESTDESIDQSLDVSVYLGRKRGSASLNSFARADVHDALDRAITIARNNSADRFTLPADSADLATDFTDLDLFDPREPGHDDLTKYAIAAEAVALAQPQITNSNGGGASYYHGHSTILISNGFRAQEQYSRHSVSASVIAGHGEGMEVGNAGSSARWTEDLQPTEEIGKLAGKRAADQLGAKPMKTGQMSVVFDPRVSASLVSAFLNAANARQVFRKETFLKDDLHKRIFPETVTLIDDPRIKRALNAGTFDAQGIARNRLAIVEDGVLKTWISTLYGARQMKIKSTGHADGFGTIIMQPGSLSVKDLIADIDEGFYVTGLQGTKADPLTGFYSTGAQGFTIRKGLITAEAVNGVTLGGNLRDIFANVTPANDIDVKEALNKTGIVPTLRVNGLMLGGV